MSNYLRMLKLYDETVPEITPYERDNSPKISKLDQIITETPAETSPNSLVAPAPTAPMTDETADMSQSINALVPAIKQLSGSGGEVASIPAGDPLADPTVDIGSPVPTTQNALASGSKDYWKTPVLGNMPLDKFVQLAGMTAHALDPKGFGGVLGKDLAQYATTERDVESKNALAKLNMERATLQNKKLLAEFDPNSPINAIRQANLRQTELATAESLRKTSRELISDVDLSTGGDSYTLVVNKLKELKADTSLLPDIKVFQNPDGTVNQDLFNKWRNNFITTADQKARMSYEDQKERTETVAVYNEKEDKQIKWTFVKPKGAGIAFDPVKEIGEGWSLTAPAKPATPSAPTAYRTFYESGVAVGKTPAQLDVEWEKRRQTEKTEATGVWSYIGDAENGRPLEKNSKSGQTRFMPLPPGVSTVSPRAGRGDSELKIAEMEGVILGKDKEGKEFGVTPGAAPLINWYNQRDTKGYIYQQTIKTEKAWHGQSNVETPTLTKTPLPIINGQQVTGKEIAEAVRESNGKYTYDQILKIILDKAKGVKK